MAVCVIFALITGLIVYLLTRDPLAGAGAGAASTLGGAMAASKQRQKSRQDAILALMRAQEAEEKNEADLAKLRDEMKDEAKHIDKLSDEEKAKLGEELLGGD